LTQQPSFQRKSACGGKDAKIRVVSQIIGILKEHEASPLVDFCQVDMSI
jgi:hypothetical protein